MSYRPVLIYDTDGEFIGYSIVRPGETKLQTTNLWKDGETEQLQEQIDRLNDQQNVLANWPSIRDPEVMELIANPDWEPLQDEPMEVVDEEASTIIEDEEGMVDHAASNIVTKVVMAPAPARVQQRIKLALETVARRRST